MEDLYRSAVYGSHQMNEKIDQQNGVLSLIIVLGGSLSLVALVFAFITYSLFSDLKSLAGTTLMNLLAALFMVQLLFIVGAGGIQDSELCVSLALSLQYLRVSVVCWLMAMSHHLYATVASIPHRDDPPTYVKYSVFAWGTPLLTFGLAILLQSHEGTNFWDIVELTPYNCWFLGKNATIYAYGLPIFLLLIASAYYLVKAAIVSRYTCSMQLEIKQREKMKKRRTLQFTMFIKFFVITGTVATCSVAFRIWQIPFLWTIFCVTHSVQGLSVALSVACNCRLLKVYARKSNQQSHQIVKSSSSMQLFAPTPDSI